MTLKFKFIVLLFLSLTAISQVDEDVQTLHDRFSQLDAEKKKKALNVFDSLRCPTCIGLSIMQSDAPFAVNMRRHVLDFIDEGQSSPAIIQFFQDRYGLWVLREPPREGWHMIAWLIPAFFLTLGLAVVGAYIYRPGYFSSKQNWQLDQETILRQMDQRLKDLDQKGSADARSNQTFHGS